MKDIMNVIAWAYKRYHLGYGFFGSFLALFNFAGIFALVFQDVFPINYSIPVLIIISFIFFSVFSMIFFGKMNMQTRLYEKDGQLNDYWKGKLSPREQKYLIGLVDSMGSKKRRVEFRKKLKRGVL